MGVRTTRPKRTYRILLMKEQYSEAADILREADKYEAYELRDVSFNGKLYVRPQVEREPRWYQSLKPHLSGSGLTLRDRTSAAVVLIDEHGRVFAVTYGYGRNLLAPGSWERDYGLKVVLNCVNPSSLRSVDCRTFEELTVQTRRQASRGSSLDVFGLDPSQDLLRQVVGEPAEQYQSLGSRVAGSDGLMLVTEADFEQLGVTCGQLLSIYRSTAYQKRFGFIDRVSPISDPETIERLDAVLIAAVLDRDTSAVHLAPPEPVDWEGLDGYVYSEGRRAEAYPDLSIEDFLGSLRRPEAVDARFLRQRKLGIRYADAVSSDMRWNSYECLTFETLMDDRYYVLTCGRWYEVEKSFAERVTNRVRKLFDPRFEMITAAPGEREIDFNKRAANALGFALVDRTCPRVDGDPVEPCDLFTPQRQLVHVKRRTRSATLSHLFQQGIVSAESLMYDIGFRKAFRMRLADLGGDLVPHIPENRLDASEFEVVYAIISPKANDLPTVLPFFSRLSLKNSADRLERLGFKVALVGINETRPE